MANKSDKPLALKTIFGSLAAIVISYILLGTFSHQVGGNFKNGVYVTVFVILSLLFIAASVWAYLVADSATRDNTSRGCVIGLAAAIIIWAGSWVAGSNEKVAPGSPQMEDVKAETDRNFKDTKEYVDYLDSLQSLPNKLVISNNYNAVVIDTSVPGWNKVLDSILISQHKGEI